MGLHVLMLGIFYLSCSAYYQPSKNHFTSIEHPQSKLPVVVELIEKLNAPPGQQPYYARLIQQGNQPFSGTIVVHFKRLKDTKDFPLGSYFGTHQYPKAVAPPKHPGQFDYKAYLQQQKIDGELTLYPKGYWFSGKNPNPSLLIRMRNWRQQGLASLAQSPLSEASEGLLGALVFGERSGLEDKQLAAFANAGVVHLLAISGLHIGLITFFILWFFKPLHRLRHWRYITALFITGILWSYALFTGLHPSVVRAVCMFSLWAIALQLKTRQDPLNIVLCSAFILLLFYPPYLFSVGFQMSYLAVLGILTGFPLLQTIWRPRWRVIRYFWQLTVVTFLAQLAVAPLSIFYFDQFPGLFMLSNWVILPFFRVLLALSFGVCILSLSGVTIDFIVALYDNIVHLFFWVVEGIAAQEQFVFAQLNLGFAEVLLVYLLLFGVLQKRKTILRWPVQSLLGLVLFAQVVLLIRSDYWLPKKELWMVYDYRTTAVVFPEHDRLNLMVTDTTLDLNYTIRFYSKYFRRARLEKKPLPSVLLLDRLRIAVCRDEHAFALADFRPTHLLVAENPKINFDRLLDSLRPQQVVFGGDNRPWRVAQWKISCQKHGIPYYNLSEQGSLKITP